MATEPVIVLPGDEIDNAYIPSHPKKPLRLGPGLQHSPPDDIIPTIAGRLATDHQKNAIRIETSGGRYTPRVGELVIGTVHHSAADAFHILLSDFTSPVLLPHLSFEGATKKTRPQLAPGALVYARVSLSDKHMDAELECVHANTGKGDGLGPLNGGGVVVLDELASAGLQFETATGRNGRFWVDSDNMKTVLAVGRAVEETDQRNLGLEEQKKLVRKIIKEMS